MAYFAGLYHHLHKPKPTATVPKTWLLTLIHLTAIRVVSHVWFTDFHGTQTENVCNWFFSERGSFSFDRYYHCYQGYQFLCVSCCVTKVQYTYTLRGRLFVKDESLSVFVRVLTSICKKMLLILLVRSKRNNS